MTTGAQVLNIVDKKIIGSADFGARLSGYLRTLVRDQNARMFDTDMTHGTGLTLSADGNDKFKIDGSDIVSDGVGNFLDADAGTHEGIQFENTSAIDYYVALKYALKPSGISINPRTGQPNYVKYIEEIGEQANPTGVTDNGSNITFVVDSVTEAGVDNTGRQVLVYMKTPAGNAITEVIAIETCTVSYSGGNNKITTTGILGQSTVSTNAADYEVILLGPTVKRYTDLRPISGYGFVGIVTGAGAGNPPTTFDVSDQNVLPISWTTALFDGLPHDLIPAADNTYSLGSAIRKWSDIFTYNLTVAANFLPFLTNSQDLGSSGLKWKDLYIDGTAYADTIHTITDFLPDSGDNQDIGSPGLKWKDLYIDGTAYIDVLELSTTVSEGVNSNFYPTADNTYNLGVKTRGWKNGHFSSTLSCHNLEVAVAGVGGGIISDVYPNLDLNHKIGDASYRWTQLFVAEIYSYDKLVLAAKNNAGNEIEDDQKFIDYSAENPPGFVNNKALGSRGLYIFSKSSDIYKRNCVLEGMFALSTKDGDESPTVNRALFSEGAAIVGGKKLIFTDRQDLTSVVAGNEANGGGLTAQAKTFLDSYSGRWCGWLYAWLRKDGTIWLALQGPEGVSQNNPAWYHNTGGSERLYGATFNAAGLPHSGFSLADYTLIDLLWVVQGNEASDGTELNEGLRLATAPDVGNGRRQFDLIQYKRDNASGGGFELVDHLWLEKLNKTSDEDGANNIRYNSDGTVGGYGSPGMPYRVTQHGRFHLKARVIGTGSYRSDVFVGLGSYRGGVGKLHPAYNSPAGTSYMNTLYPQALQHLRVDTGIGTAPFEEDTSSGEYEFVFQGSNNISHQINFVNKSGDVELDMSVYGLGFYWDRREVQYNNKDV